jgi:iron complex outermembrane recepter protein
MSRRKNRTRRPLAVAIATASVTLPAAAPHAQDVAASESAPAAAYQETADDKTKSVDAGGFDSMIDNLIITGKKRESRIQQTPISLSEFRQDDFTKSNVRRLDDVPKQVPNLLVDQGIGLGNTARTSLRGLSTNQSSSAADPVIGIYVDGVYRTRLQGALTSLFDVESVEVLRGPQGTLFGKNTVGGAINITTKAPEFDFGGEAELRIGNFDMIESRLALNVPLVPEMAAMRLSLATATRDGYFSNQVNGDEYADNKLLSGRLQLLVTPTQDLEVLLSFENSKENKTGTGVKCVPIGRGNGVPGQIAERIGFREACARDTARSEFKVASDVSFTGDDLRTTASSARVSWDMSPNITLTSISAWRRQVGETFFNVDGTELPLIQFQNDGGNDVQNQFSQEFRLIGNAMDGRLQYIAGAFALAEEANESEFFGLGFMPVVGPMGMVTAVNPNPAFNRNILKTDNRSLALYGQTIFSITEQLELTLGARVTKDTKRVFLDQRIGACRPGPVGDVCRQRGLVGMGNAGPNSFTGFERSGRFDEITPSVRLAYAFSPTFLLYTSYAKGFQSGGFDGRAASPADTNELANQELTAYEFGVKSTWFDNRFVFNASYFYNILEDGTRVPVPTVTASGQLAQSQGLNARALVRGGELEMTALPWDGLTLRSSLGVQRGEINDSARASMMGIRNALLPIVPNYTMNFGFDYERPLGWIGTLGLSSSWSVRGRLNPVIQAPDQLTVSKYGLLDGRVSLELPDGRTSIAAFGTNLLDRRYFNAGFSSAETFGFGVRFFGPPRFYGLELRRSF